jgi:hypothetical protein
MADATRLAQIESDLLERVAALHAEGPGDVRVSRVSDIAAVRALRECRAVLDVEEVAWLNATVEVVGREAFGIQLSGQSRLSQEAGAFGPDKDPNDKLSSVMTSAAWGVFGLAKKIKFKPRKGPPRSGEPLPAPEHLLHAAEARAIAALCKGRVDADLTRLCEPWRQAVDS